MIKTSRFILLSSRTRPLWALCGLLLLAVVLLTPSLHQLSGHHNPGGKCLVCVLLNRTSLALAAPIVVLICRRHISPITMASAASPHIGVSHHIASRAPPLPI